MKLAAIAIFALTLTACSQINETEQKAIIARDVAEKASNKAYGNEARIIELERKQAMLDRDVDSLRELALANSDSTDHLRNTVNNNAKVNNENAVRDMTRRGACGYRDVYPPRRGEDGGWIISERIPCTEKDLKP